MDALDRIMAMNLDVDDEIELIRKEVQGERGMLRIMELLYISGKRKEAFSIAEEMGSTKSLYFLGKVSLDEEQRDKARKYLEEALQKAEGEDLHLVTKELADLYLSEGRAEEAVRILSRASGIREDATYLEKLSWGHHLLGNKERSLKYLDMFRELCEEDKQLARYSVLKAWYLSEQGDSTEILDILKESAELRIADDDGLSNTLYYLVLSKLYRRGEIPSYELDEQICLRRALHIAERSGNKVAISLVRRQEEV